MIIFVFHDCFCIFTKIVTLSMIAFVFTKMGYAHLGDYTTAPFKGTVLMMTRQKRTF